MATVNGVAISKNDYVDYLVRKPQVEVVLQNQTVNAPVVGTVGLQAMRDLVNRQLVIQMAKEANVMPTSADVEAEIAFRTKRTPNYVTNLTSQGITLSIIRRDIEVELAQEKLLTRGITVTPDDVDKWIKEHPEQFQQPPSVDAMFIMVKSAAKEKQIDTDLLAGQGFEVVAVRYSEAPNARATGAKVAEHNLTRYPDALRKVIEKTPEGQSTPWISFEGQNFKFFVNRLIPANTVKIDDTIKELVRREIAKERGTRATDLAQRLNDKLRTSTIDVKLTALKDPWDKAMAALKSKDVTKANTPGQANIGTTAPTGATAAPASGPATAPATGTTPGAKGK